MMMQCPRCSTRWRVAAAAPVENPLFKCGRCHHLFRQFPGAPPVPDAAPSATRRSTTAPPAEPDTLEFIFPERQSAELLLSDDATVVDREPVVAAAPPVAPASETTAIVSAPPSPPPVILRGPVDQMIASAIDEPTAIDEPRASASNRTIASDEPAFAIDETAEFAVDEPLAVDAEGDLDAEDDIVDADERIEHVLGDPPAIGRDLLADPAEEDEPTLANFDDEDDDEDDQDGVADEPVPTVDRGRRVRVEDTMRAPAGFGTIMRAMGTAVAGFAALALTIRVAPEQATAWLSKLPIAGASFAHDHGLATKVELTNVNGRFQRLRNSRRVFVISGDARNNSATTIERIEVAGSLYGLGGGELEQKVVTTGNRTALTDLSEAEIVLLQRLDPAIALAPGQTTPFLIVFLEPPRELREFSSRVLSVRPTRRASSPAEPSRGSVG